MKGFLTTWEGRVLVLGALGIIVGFFILFTTPANRSNQKTSMTLTISSPAFTQNGIIPALFTCDGKGISPELDFANIPTNAQSLALIMEDPDAPRGIWDHWVVWNMSSTTTKIKEGSVPPGMIGKNTAGDTTYEGPCPPDREHRYVFTLYALDTLLSLPQGSTKNEVIKALTPHIIEKAQLIGRYNRK